MKKEIYIGVVCIARRTYNFESAFEIYQNLQTTLSQIENVTWEFIPDLVIEVEDAQQAAQTLAAKQVDAYICISGTFALGHLILELNKVIQKPVLLWGLEELPYNGGKIRLNSVCGINLNSSNLYKAGVKNYHVIIANEIDPNWLDAIRVIKAFKTAHAGMLGYRAHGFFNLSVEEPDLYAKTGVLIDHYELQEVYNIEVNDDDVANRKQEISEKFDVSGITEEQVDKVALLTAKFDAFLIKNKLTVVAVRCWPEFAANFGISPSAAMSILQSEGKILSCEGDLLGGLSMLAHQAVGAETPFLADFSQVNFNENFALLWHCGVAPAIYGMVNAFNL